MAQGPTTMASPVSLLEKQTLRSGPRPTKSYSALQDSRLFTNRMEVQEAPDWTERVYVDFSILDLPLCAWFRGLGSQRRLLLSAFINSIKTGTLYARDSSRYRQKSLL